MSVAIAMVALGEGAKISASAIQNDLQTTWPHLPTPAAPEKGDGTISIQVGDAMIIYGLMPAPIPWPELEGPCATSWLWPDAEDALRNHQGHVIVTVKSEADPIERAKLLTMATAAFLKACEAAVGVYWGNATLVISPELFREFAVEMLPDGLPVHVWVDFRVGKYESGKMAGFTAGMAALGHMEFETVNSPEPPGELRERFFGLACYLLENGPIIKDGETFGQSADERIKVTYTGSQFGHDGQVMLLDYEAAGKKKRSWFGLG